MEDGGSLPGSPRILTAPPRFLTPPGSPRDRRTRLGQPSSPLTSSPPATLRAGRWGNLRKKLAALEPQPSPTSSPSLARAPLAAHPIDPLPFLDPTKKDWILAAAANNGVEVRLLLQQSPSLLTVADPYSGYTALHWAAKHDNVDMVTLLMEHAAMLAVQNQVVNWRSNGGYTPLHIAAINQASQAFALLMMDYKADRKIRDFSGKMATSYLRTVLTTNLALSKIKEKYKGALIDLDTRRELPVNDVLVKK